MRYLARSFVGGTSRFALTLPDQDDHWTHLGIVPVHFPKRIAPDEYGALDDAIESWNAAARMGVFDHRLRIGQLVALPPPLEPENIDYLRGVVTDPVTLRFFVEPHSEAIGKLLADLLPHVTEVRHDTGELFDLAAGALAGGADRADVRQIAAEMLRLGLMDGERLRRIADEALDST